MSHLLSRAVVCLPFLRLASCLLTLLFLPGCGVIYSYINNEDKLDDRLSVPMSREQVLDKLGKPDKVITDDGRQITWEYPLYSRYHWVKELLLCPISVWVGGCILYPYVGILVGNTDPHYVVLLEEQLCMWGPRSVVNTRKTCKAPIRARQAAIPDKSKEDIKQGSNAISSLPVLVPPRIKAKVHRLAILPLSDAAGHTLPTWLDLTLNILRNQHTEIVLVERDLRPVLAEVLLQYSGQISDETTVRVGRLAGADSLITYSIEPFPQSSSSSMSRYGGAVAGMVELKLVNVEEGTVLFRQRAMATADVPAPRQGLWSDEVIREAHRAAVSEATSYAMAALVSSFGDNPLGLVPDFQVRGAATVLGVLDGSPAHLADLRKGDRVLMVNGRPITTWTSLVPISLPAFLTIEREGNQREVTVTKP